MQLVLSSMLCVRLAVLAGCVRRASVALRSRLPRDSSYVLSQGTVASTWLVVHSLVYYRDRSALSLSRLDRGSSDHRRRRSAPTLMCDLLCVCVMLRRTVVTLVESVELAVPAVTVVSKHSPADSRSATPSSRIY